MGAKRWKAIIYVVLLFESIASSRLRSGTEDVSITQYIVPWFLLYLSES